MERSIPKLKEKATRFSKIGLMFYGICSVSYGWDPGQTLGPLEDEVGVIMLFGILQAVVLIKYCMTQIQQI